MLPTRVSSPTNRGRPDLGVALPALASHPPSRRQTSKRLNRREWRRKTMRLWIRQKSGSNHYYVLSLLVSFNRENFLKYFVYYLYNVMPIK